MRERLRGLWTPQLGLEALGVGLVMLVTLWELHPSLVFSSTLLTGGDTGSHLALPAYLRTQGNLFNLTPWYPGWFAGMPAYTYYFVMADYFATLSSYVIGFAHAFKLASIMGSMLLPVTAYCMGRLFKAPRPVPVALALSTLPFLFDASFTIDGGNLFSTMAGEYAYSLALALALLTIGLFARGLRTGRGYWWAALALSATLAAHVLPWFYALAAVGVMVVFELLLRRGHGDPKDRDVVGDLARPVRFAVGAGLLSFGLSAWWLLSFLTTQRFTNSMGYSNDNVSNLHSIFTTLGWFTSTGGAAGDRWVIVLAVVAFVVAFVVRDRLGMILATLIAVSFVAFVFDPQSAIWNERLVPCWFISTHLAVGWLFGYALSRWVGAAAHGRRGLFLFLGDGRIAYTFTPLDEPATGTAKDESLDIQPDSSFETEDEVAAETRGLADWKATLAGESAGERTARRTKRATVSVIVLGLASVVPGLMPPVASALGLTTTGNQVSSWAAWNYSGYQSKPAWPEYRDLMTTMSHVARHYGCGRAMWEYNSAQNRFGTPMALMLMPYWTNNCVDSMEGLFFESSATTPYHFLNAAEVSPGASNPQVGLAYGKLDVTMGVEHLQMLGVKYFVAFSPSVIKEANADSSLKYVASTRAWPSPGVTWRVYRILNSPMVQPLTMLPNVIAGIGSRQAWLAANTSWWLDPSKWATLGAESGPANWPRATSVSNMHYVAVNLTATVSRVRVGTQSLSFHVDHTGVPMLVKISYFPRWHASGATGPFRVSPNLMVVIPTSHDVTLVYGSTPALLIGNVISDVAVIAMLATVWFALRRRRFQRL